jgi:DNA-binding transcriptional MerR regulator
MNGPSSTLWTIVELTARVERELAVGYAGAGNGRVRDIPDLRTIRYYTTLGLLDRPALMRGRTALYGRRHLLQIVAIKRLQSLGQSLVQVQERIAGATERELESLAGVPADSAAEGSDALSGAIASEVTHRPFWKARPPQFASGPPSPVASTRQRRGEPESASASPAYNEMMPLQAIELTDRVMLLLVPARPIDRDELPAISQAAAPLIRHLANHQLVHSIPKGDRDDPGASPVD